MKDVDLQFCIHNTKRIAQNGSINEKISFVEWISAAISWTSAQAAFDEESRENLQDLQKIYKEYLNALCVLEEKKGEQKK